MSDTRRDLDRCGGKDDAGKPRPIVIVQDDRFDATSSVTICAFTGDPTDSPLLRLVVEPSEANGLERVSRLMVDKVTTVPKAKSREADRQAFGCRRGTSEPRARDLPRLSRMSSATGAALRGGRLLHGADRLSRGRRCWLKECRAHQ